MLIFICKIKTFIYWTSKNKPTQTFIHYRRLNARASNHLIKIHLLKDPTADTSKHDGQNRICCQVLIFKSEDEVIFVSLKSKNLNKMWEWSNRIHVFTLFYVRPIRKVITLGFFTSYKTLNFPHIPLLQNWI